MSVLMNDLAKTFYVVKEIPALTNPDMCANSSDVRRKFEYANFKIRTSCANSSMRISMINRVNSNKKLNAIELYRKGS